DDAHLAEERPGADEHRRLARVEVHRRERIALVERVAAAASALGDEREVRVPKAREVAVRRANRHAESLGDRLGGRAGAAAAQILGDGEETFGALHAPSKLTFS